MLRVMCLDCLSNRDFLSGKWQKLCVKTDVSKNVDNNTDLLKNCHCLQSTSSLDKIYHVTGVGGEDSSSEVWLGLVKY